MPSKDGGRNLAYALYVLARNGTAPLGDLRYLADAKLDDLGTPIAKAQIAAALGLLGDRIRAERVYKAALDDLKPPAQTELFSREDYGSTAARRGGAGDARQRRPAARGRPSSTRSPRSSRRGRARPTPRRRRTPGW